MSHRIIAGVDEAGRGPLAGPVVAAACVLPQNASFPLLTDSKLLSPDQREKLFEEITQTTLYSIAVVDHETIDQINILKAALEAMRQAVDTLSVRPHEVLVDGPHTPFLSMPCEGIVKGDLLEPCISAASILAKVERDRLMHLFHEQWPMYQFDKNKGYGTRAHLEALKEYGPCPIHRKTFNPVKQYYEAALCS